MAEEKKTQQTDDTVISMRQSYVVHWAHGCERGAADRSFCDALGFLCITTRNVQLLSEVC